jgi:ubiquinol oxidase
VLDTTYRHDGDLITHTPPKDVHDRIALRTVKFMRVVADAFGMVGGLLQHLKAIRYIREDEGWIRELLDEAENERMHLMTFIRIAQPSRFERILIMVGQMVFNNFYFFLYLLAPRTAHRVVAYLEEEAVISYTQYLAELDAGNVENVPAPQLAIDYWNMQPDAHLRDVIIQVRADEAGHRDRNHEMADKLAG